MGAPTVIQGAKGDKGDKGDKGITNTSNYSSFKYDTNVTNTTSLGSFQLVGTTGVSYLAIITYDITITNPVDWILNIKGVKSEQSINYSGTIARVQDQLILTADAGSLITLTSPTSKVCTGHTYMYFVPMSS